MFYSQMSDALNGRTRQIVDAINNEILDSWLRNIEIQNLQRFIRIKYQSAGHHKAVITIGTQNIVIN